VTDVLVIEDDTDIRGLVVSRLVRLGCEVRQAATGEVGMAELERLPDLLILDVGLPGIDGWEVLRRLRQDPEGASLPVLVLSIERPTTLEGLQPGAFVPKPFSARVFEAAVGRLLDAASGGDV
jgi:DNA-binding response OmpR family regulator